MRCAMGSDFWGATRLRASYGQGIKEPEFFVFRRTLAARNPNLRRSKAGPSMPELDQCLRPTGSAFRPRYFHNDFTIS